jgi:glycosyltransferase involved in cell wall biosynthesis/ElaB/YqjD/DUF883 family membrane-anchored ribosome-binding protein
LNNSDTNGSNRKLKIVIGCDTFPPDINGAARFAERLAGGLVKHGHEVHIIAPAYSEAFGDFTEIHDDVSMTVHRIRSFKMPQHKTLRWIWPYTLKSQTDALLRRIQPDAVHIQSHLIMGRYLAKSAKEQGIRLLATNHIMPENLIKYSVIIPKWFEKTAMKLAWRDAGRILRSADFITTPTRRAANLLEAAAGLDGVLAISCGIDASKFANAKPTSNENPSILFLGRLDYEKHIHNLLKAVAMLPKSLNVKVELVGDGGERKHLEQLAFELGIAQNVKFLGHITDEELPLAYERATVFAMPSIAMEAMASGRPVVAADAMALPHLVHDGDNGYLFPPDDVVAFADRLRRVLTADEAELKRLSSNSLHLIQAHDIQRTISIFEGLYRGDKDGERTTQDNEDDYLRSIGRLTDVLQERVDALRATAISMRERASERGEEVREEVRERIEEVREKLDEVRDEVKERANEVKKKVKKSVKRASERLKSGD